MNLISTPINLIKKRKKKYYVLIFLILSVLFINSFFAGQYLYQTDKKKAEDFILQIKNIEKLRVVDNMLQDRHYITATLTVFANNFLIDVFAFYSGIILLSPVLIPLSNVLLFGFMMGIESVMPSFSMSFSRMLLFVIVAFMELSAMIIITYEGLRLGISFINPKVLGKKKRKDALKQSLSEGSKILFLIALILIISAIVEIMGIVFLELHH